MTRRVLSGRRRDPSARRRHGRRRQGALPAWLAFLAAGLGGCTSSPTPPPVAPVLEAADPRPDAVEALVLLVGDAGTAHPGRSPLLARVADDIDAWSRLLDPGATAVAYLGDLVYPSGVRPPGDPGHPEDTLRLHAQLTPLLGSNARSRRARGWFLDGNHDWGHLPGDAGLARLRNLHAVVQRWAEAGHEVRLAPAPGMLGPTVVDVGDRHRILMVGSHAWLEASEERRETAVVALREALSETDRTVIVLAHHPLQSAGEHGDDPPLETGFGFQYLASQAGLITQDLSSRAYRTLVADVTRALTPRRPLVWAAGHDHTLQLLRGEDPGSPRWTVVSGSASKLGLLGSTPTLVAGGAWPGYARLFLLADGTVQLQFVAAPSRAQHCRDAADADLDACMADGSAAYRTVVSRILSGSRP